jgi:hypothetical protein
MGIYKLKAVSVQKYNVPIKKLYLEIGLKLKNKSIS